MKHGIARSVALFVLASASFSSIAWAGDGNFSSHLGGSRTCLWGECTGTEFTYGVALGYDADVGKNVFIGAQAMLDSIRSDGDAYANYGAVARFGFKASDKSRIYAMGGYAAQQIGYGTGTWAGWRTGAGYEQNIGDNTFIKVEYRYSRYRKYGLSFNQNTGLVGL